MASASGTQFSRPRKVSVLTNYEKAVLSAFKWDCEMFLEQFEKENSFNYAQFANIWQLNNFTYIYADQTFVGLLRVLCEVCFMTVKKYFIFQKSLYLKVGAFYLLYGLYYKQPIEGLVKIRLTLAEYREIKHVMDEMFNRAQYDALYIFAKMKSDNVFQYTAVPKPLSIELNKSVKSLTHLDDTFQNRGTESALNKFKEVLEDKTVQALEKTCSEYDTLLQKYSEKHPSVLQFKSTIISDLSQAHSKVFTQVSAELSEDTQINDTQSPRLSVRFRALHNKNAEYRGSKKVCTALDLQDAVKKKNAIKGRNKPKRGVKKGSKKSAHLDSSSDSDDELC